MVSCSSLGFGFSFLYHFSSEILEDSDVPIFPVVISTLGSLQSSLNHYCDCTGIPLSTFCTEVNTICIWLYVQCQRATDKSDETFLQKIMSSCSSLEVFLLTSQTHKKWNPISPWIFPLFGGDGYAMVFIILRWLPQKKLPPKKFHPSSMLSQLEYLIEALSTSAQCQ